MPVTTISSYEQFEQIINSGKPAVIDFWATWCGPCKVISPIFERFSNSDEFADDVDFYKVDVDEQEQIAAEVGIRAMPTFMSFKDGKQQKHLVGANPQGLQV
ncbi:thioredoxin-like protein [Mycena floridula]|nr:thioredoxin-like protein [Mycena floridula]